MHRAQHVGCSLSKTAKHMLQCVESTETRGINMQCGCWLMQGQAHIHELRCNMQSLSPRCLSPLAACAERAKVSSPPPPRARKHHTDQHTHTHTHTCGWTAHLRAAQAADCPSPSPSMQRCKPATTAAAGNGVGINVCACGVLNGVADGRRGLASGCTCPHLPCAGRAYPVPAA